MTTSLIFLGLIFGSVGTGYCVYGRRQGAPVPFLSGVLLIAVPYLISNLALLLIVGVVLALAPFLIAF